MEVFPCCAITPRDSPRSKHGAEELINVGMAGIHGCGSDLVCRLGRGEDDLRRRKRPEVEIPYCRKRIARGDFRVNVLGGRTGWEARHGLGEEGEVAEEKRVRGFRLVMCQYGPGGGGGGQ